MKKYLKRTIIVVSVLVGIILIVYGGYKLYDYLITNATARIKQGVTEGVKGGFNPLGWIK